MIMNKWDYLRFLAEYWLFLIFFSLKILNCGFDFWCSDNLPPPLRLPTNNFEHQRWLLYCSNLWNNHVKTSWLLKGLIPKIKVAFFKRRLYFIYNRTLSIFTGAIIWEISLFYREKDNWKQWYLFHSWWT